MEVSVFNGSVKKQERSTVLRRVLRTVDIHLSASELVLLGVGEGVGSGSEEVEGTIDVLDDGDSSEELGGVGTGVGAGVGVGVGVGVGATDAVEDVSVEPVSEDAIAAEVVTGGGGTELDETLEIEMEELEAEVVAIELGDAGQIVTD